MIEVDETPEWLTVFASKVAGAYEMFNPSDQAISWNWAVEKDEDGEAFEVYVYPNLVEAEGKVCGPGQLSIHISTILELFEDVIDISWTSDLADDVDGLSISGRVNGHEMWLRLRNYAPEDALPTARVHPDGSFEDIEDDSKGAAS